MTELCQVVGCLRKATSRGLCHAHYVRSTRGAELNTTIRESKTTEVRFMEKLGVKDPSTGCVEWESSRNERGYGSFWTGGRSVKAHRFAWELHNGPVPEGMLVCHTCDNPTCCNVEHLFLGTNADNSDDKVAKGRQAAVRGERQGNAKLSEKNIETIRILLVDGLSQRKIAVMFGIDQTTVSKINRGKNWRHVKAPARL